MSQLKLQGMKTGDGASGSHLKEILQRHEAAQTIMSYMAPGPQFNLPKRGKVGGDKLHFSSQERASDLTRREILILQAIWNNFQLCKCCFYTQAMKVNLKQEKMTNSQSEEK